MPVIAPSILSADFANLERDIHNIEANGADWVHVDVMDGIFVPNISIGIPVVKALRPVTSLPLDVHLMIDRPIRYAEEFIKAGADWLTIHLESDQPQNTLACLDKIRAMGCKAAISLKPKTPAEAAIPYLTKCDMVLVMTVEPGFGAQKFMADMMPKVKKSPPDAGRGKPRLHHRGGRRRRRCDVQNLPGKRCGSAGSPGSAFSKARRPGGVRQDPSRVIFSRKKRTRLPSGNRVQIVCAQQ